MNESPYCQFHCKHGWCTNGASRLIIESHLMMFILLLMISLTFLEDIFERDSQKQNKKRGGNAEEIMWY